MNRKFWTFIILTFSLAACGGDGTDYVDERHRPTDWESELQLTVVVDTSMDGVEKLNVISYTASKSIEPLLDQAYNVAFSGDADVRLPNFLGDIGDESITPEELLEALQQFDTSMVQDLYTGEMKDTVVDVSFRKSTASLLHLSFDANPTNDQNVLIKPEALGIGSVQYDEDLSIKGFRIRFYQILNGAEDLKSAHQMVFTTDSLGIFRPLEFNTYDSEQGNTLIDKFHLIGDTIHLDLFMRFDYSNQNLEFKLSNKKRTEA